MTEISDLQSSVAEKADKLASAEEQVPYSVEITVDPSLQYKCTAAVQCSFLTQFLTVILFLSILKLMVIYTYFKAAWC